MVYLLLFLASRQFDKMRFFFFPFIQQTNKSWRVMRKANYLFFFSLGNNTRLFPPCLENRAGIHTTFWGPVVVAIHQNLEMTIVFFAILPALSMSKRQAGNLQGWYFWESPCISTEQSTEAPNQRCNWAIRLHVRCTLLLFFFSFFFFLTRAPRQPGLRLVWLRKGTKKT